MSARHSVVFTSDPLPAEIDDPLRELGGKGMSLRRMAAAGCRVPRGFTICSSAGRGITCPDAPLSEAARSEISKALQRLERETGRGLSADGDERLLLAVRSGAARSMPGLLTTHLRVPADTSEEIDPRLGVWRAVTDVFASWHTTAARGFRETAGIDETPGTAVTIQEHVDCLIGGVLFTQDPDRPDVMTLEAVVGSGEALVSGRATPCRWLIDRRDLSIVDGPAEDSITQADRDAIDKVNCKLAGLCQSGLQLEDDFGHPLDIEWGIDEDGLIFFQARAINITTFVCDGDRFRRREVDRLRGLVPNGCRLWVRHNLSETLPSPTPLTWSLWRQFMSNCGGLGTLYRRLGYSPATHANGFLELIGGQIYADPTRATGMFGESYPFCFDIDELRRDPAVIHRPPTQFDPARCDPWLLWKLPVVLWRTIRLRSRISSLMMSAAADFEQKAVPAFLTRLDQLQKPRCTQLDDAQTADRLEECRQLVFDDFGPESLLPGTLGAISFQALVHQLTPIFGADEAGCLAQDVSPSGDQSLFEEQRALLLGIADDDRSKEPFLGAFGHRAIGEMELAIPRWRETPGMLHSMAAEIRAAGTAPRGPSPFLDRSAAADLLASRLKSAAASSLSGPIQLAFDHCRRLLPFRERGKHVFLMGYALLRQLVEEAGRRLQLREDVYFVTYRELIDGLRGQVIPPDIDHRREEWEAFCDWPLPDVIDSDSLEALLDVNRRRNKKAHRLAGAGLVSGQGQGSIVTKEGLMTSEAKPRGMVLLCRALEPSLAPLLSRVTAVIVEQGGTLSHGAILARYLGIPVVRLAGAMSQISTGQRVRVDGSTGDIEMPGTE